MEAGRKQFRFLVFLSSPFLWAAGLLIYVFAILPVFLLRFLLLRAINGESEEEVSFFPDMGFVFLGSETPKHCPSVLLGYTLAEGTLSLEELRHKFTDLVLQAKNAETGRLLYPKYRQVLRTFLGLNFWQADKSFQLEDHIRLLEGINTSVVTTEEQLMPLLGPLSNKGFEPDRPLWEYLVVPNYLPSYSPAGPPKTLVIYRIHHGLCDGYSILKCFVQHTCQDSLEKVVRPASPSNRQRQSSLEQLMKLGALVAEMPFCLLQQITNWDSNAWFLSRSQLQRECHLGMTHRIPIKLLKQISQAQGVSFSAVLFSAVGGGIHRYFQQTYAGTLPTPDVLQCFTPFPNPNHPDSQLVNNWACAVIKLFPSISCPLARLQANEANLSDTKASTFHISSTVLLGWLAALPRILISIFSRNWFSSCVLSNFPGPKTAVSYFRTHLVHDICFWTPHLNGSSGVGISVLSYVDHLRFGLNVDKALLPRQSDVDALCGCIEQEIRHLLSLSDSSGATGSSTTTKMDEVDVGAYASRESLRRRSVS